jgi:hypothetical protein
MKKFLIVSFLAFLSGAGFAQLHTTRRALIEEFTSSSSDSCATTDMVFDQFEGEAPGKFCIVKWYLPYGTIGGKNQFYKDYLLSLVRSQGYYANDTVPRIFLNGGKSFDPTGLPLDSLRAQLTPEYSKTSPFTLDITQQVIGDSVIANITVRQLDTAIDLTKLSIGVIVTERYNPNFTDVNHYPYHTNIVRTVLPSLDPKSGQIRDAFPFALAMQGRSVQSFRFASALGGDWDRFGLASIGVIQDNSTKEVLQCNWTVPEITFYRPTPSTYLFLNGATPCQFLLTNKTDSDFTITPQFINNAPPEWNLKLQGMDYPNFVLKAHSSANGTFVSESVIPFRGSCDFTLLLRTAPGIIVANISGTLIGYDSRDLIIKNWASSVYQSDPDIQTWKQFGLDAAICNDDAIGDLFNNNLLNFRTVYVERSNYGDSTALESIKEYMAHGGRMIFNSNSVLKYFSNSIIDTTVNKYALTFEQIFHTIPAGTGLLQWTKGNVVAGNVFSDTLPIPFVIAKRPIEPLLPIDSFSKPLVKEQGGTVVATSVESSLGKIAYLTFPLSDIQDPNTTLLMTGQILKWFQSPVAKVAQPVSQEFSATVYPNPVTSTAKLEYNFFSIEKPTLTLHDELGKLIAPPIQNMNGNQLSIDCSSLASGTYYYSLQNGVQVIHGKFIVNH